jgi:5-deoxy-glucuronate isomerase
MKIPHKPPFNYGYTQLVPKSGATADMLMEFGILKLKPGDKWEHSSETDEQCLLLAEGSANLTWTVRSPGGGLQHAAISRLGLFDHCPFCLSVPSCTTITVEVLKDGAEFYYCATENSKYFSAKLFAPEEGTCEFRGMGTMRETSTRIVRTVFDHINRPDSNLLIGEVIGVPGKWSSYPPHHHPQPEIYHYRFLPENGFGLTAIGDKPYILRDKDTVLIREGEVHPQVTAPGYAMWYLWVIRHLEGAHYGPGSNTPIFVDEHRWVMEGEDGIWQPKNK